MNPTVFLKFAHAVLVLILWTATAVAQPVPVPSPPEVPADAYLLMDYDSGRVLVMRNADKPMEPASITKLMTAYVADVALRDNDINLNDSVPVSERAWRTEGSRMFIEVGKSVPVKDLLRGLVIQSGNDAAVALAEQVAGSESAFAALMNHHAELLGLTGTHYVNATGLPDPELYTTARDIATLSQAIIRDFPDNYRLYAEKEFTFNGIKQYNRNQLLWRDESVDGLKTGHTESAGFCLVASAKRGDQRLISVVLGSPSEKARTSASQALLNYGFRFFSTHKLYDAQQQLAQARVWKGAEKDLPLTLEQPLYVTIPRGRYEDLQASMTIQPDIEAPVARGTRLGTVTVALDEETLAEVPLVATKAVPEGGLVSRVMDQGLMLIQSLFE
jgi:D-alanyl-D-alanine carboxypeptidase (penicillin-binding protein 5/6)